MSNKKAVSVEDRKNSILIAGAKLASKIGPSNVTRRAVATAAKVSEALVAHYVGGTADAQAAYKKMAKKLALPLPDKDKEESIGKKMRSHGPRAKPAPRKRSVKEVKAIKEKARPVVPKVTKPKTVKETVKRLAAKVDVPKVSVAAAQAALVETKALGDAPSNKVRGPMVPKAAPILPPLVVVE